MAVPDPVRVVRDEWRAAVLRGGRPLTNGIKLLLVVLADDHMTEEGRVRVKYAVLAAALDVSVSNVSQRLGSARTAGWLVVYARAGFGYPPGYQATLPGALWSPATTNHGAGPPTTQKTCDLAGPPTTQKTCDLPKVTAESNHRGAPAAAATTALGLDESRKSSSSKRRRSSPKLGPRPPATKPTSDLIEIERARQLRDLEQLPPSETS